MKKIGFALLITMLIITGCGKIEQTADYKKDDIESTTEEQIENNEDDKRQEIDDIDDSETFNDFVEVSFEHKDYLITDDGKPDYSGIYCIGNYSTTYGYCNLIKQKDGSYYCDIFEARAFHFETKAEYKSDNTLAIADDEISGTITVDYDSAAVSIVDESGTEIDEEYTNCKYEYSDLSQYTGTYSYTKMDGSKVVITVGYDEKRAPFITFEDDDETVEFRHDPSDYGIFVFQDECYGDILYASIECEAWEPVSRIFPFTKEYEGDKYLIIRFDDDTPYVYYKAFRPEVMR